MIFFCLFGVENPPNQKREGLNFSTFVFLFFFEMFNTVQQRHYFVDTLNVTLLNPGCKTACQQGMLTPRRWLIVGVHLLWGSYLDQVQIRSKEATCYFLDGYTDLFTHHQDGLDKDDAEASAPSRYLNAGGIIGMAWVMHPRSFFWFWALLWLWKMPFATNMQMAWPFARCGTKSQDTHHRHDLAWWTSSTPFLESSGWTVISF